MISRSYAVAPIMRLADGPDAIDWISNGEPLDWESILSDQDSNILVRDDETDAHGLFQYRAPRLWEFHVVCPPDIRGKRAAKAINGILAWFSDTSDDEVYCKCHVANRRVRWLAPHCGFRFEQTMDGQAYFTRTSK